MKVEPDSTVAGDMLALFYRIYPLADEGATVVAFIESTQPVPMLDDEGDPVPDEAAPMFCAVIAYALDGVAGKMLLNYTPDVRLRQVLANAAPSKDMQLEKRLAGNSGKPKKRTATLRRNIEVV